MADHPPPRRSTSSDTSAEEISPALLGAIQQIVSAAVREQVAALAPVCIATPSDVEVPEEEPGEAVPAPAPPTIRRPDIHSSVPQEFPANWLARLECLQNGLQDVQYQIGGAPKEERQGVPFTEAAQTWFNQLPAGAIESFQEFRSLFLHQSASSRKLRKTELSLFAIRQKDNEPLKEYLQRFNTAALEVPSATQEVKASAFSQSLWDGEFFKSLAKKPVTKFDALLARAAKYINMEDARAAKKESRGEKRKDAKEETPNRFQGKESSYQRINAVYTPLMVPITQALMAVEGKALLARPRSWRDRPQRPQSDKFCRFHNDYGHTTEECHHLKNKIERLIQNGYLQEYVCRRKPGDGSISKERSRKAEEPRGANQEALPRENPQAGMKEKTDADNVPRKGIIRMITGGPVGGDSHHARKAKIRRAHSETITEYWT
ncbi:UNVERIFIED_CONTAM: hypothetical protein Sradi_0169500 [Sesamum radiatum]|uniref:Retrotransposon gag domain-containing protein n=1 Tax=Sesamum radiatum TaxID=300843 RepID=A0AAW2W045_SESRA